MPSERGVWGTTNKKTTSFIWRAPNKRRSLKLFVVSHTPGRFTKSLVDHVTDASDGGGHIKAAASGISHMVYYIHEDSIVRSEKLVEGLVLDQCQWQYLT